MSPTRSLLARALVVLAIVSLASIALAPRGMLRAAAAAQLSPAAGPSHASIGTPDDGVELPGVRALVSKEEQDPEQALLDSITTGPAPDPTAHVVPAPPQRADAEVAPPGTSPPASADRERAPPTSI